MSDTPISYAPTDGLSYDPSEPVYWEAGALDREVERVFEICHGCRMCFKYCDSFPILFARVDEEGGDVRRLEGRDTARVMDACFQCKLCEVQCPYTPRDGHEFQLDFPRLVHRWKAQRTRRDGLPLRDRLLEDPDRAGRMARASLGLADKLNRVAAHRWFLEKLVGIDRRKQLPPFASTTFERWARRTGRLVEPAAVPRSEPAPEAVLFPTCYVENNEPAIGRDTLEVLEKNGLRIACTSGLACCGMPAWERGDLALLREKAHASLERLEPFVEAGAKVVAINPTCSMMLRREWPELLEGADRERARRLSERVVDPSELLWSIREEERFAPLAKREGAFAYHAPCHLRAQAIGFRGRDVIKKILGLAPTMVMECCGHDGTFAMTVEGFEASQKVGAKAFDDMRAADAPLWVTDCPLAALQFEQHAGVRPLHPMSVLARAYRGETLPGASPAGAAREPTQEPSS